ncbi:MAG: MBL fold metallo-hydrolase [Gaiella sp.]
MLFRQFVDDDLGCASYLIGCEACGEAVVVDPPYAIEPLLEEAARRSVRIVRVIETHTHADHLSGHGRLALEHGSRVSVHPEAEAEYAHDPLSDGAEIRVGNVTLRCIHTPGHRPEHCCLAVIDHTRAEEPWLLLTGDSLFVGDTARPDLAVGGEEGAAGLYRSLQHLLELPDGIEVYPGHVAGSLCGKGMSSKASTTLGFERRFNPMLAFGDAASFIRASASLTTPKPPNIARIVELNRGPFVGSPPPVVSIAAPPTGAQIVDVRPTAEYLAGHREAALSVPIDGGSFATKAGYLLDPESSPLAVAAGDPGQAARAVRGLRSVGFLEIAGWLDGAGDVVMRTTSVHELDGIGATAQLVDVRESDEWESGHHPVALHIPYHQAAARAAELDPSRSVVTVCETGARAVVAASVLERLGFDTRPIASGGMANWHPGG